jgi:hypothetical protein
VAAPGCGQGCLSRKLNRVAKGSRHARECRFSV